MKYKNSAIPYLLILLSLLIGLPIYDAKIDSAQVLEYKIKVPNTETEKLVCTEASNNLIAQLNNTPN